MTGLLIVSVIILTLTLLIITKHRHFLDSYRQELLQALQESQAVKSDLEKLMHQAVQLSNEVVTKLEHSVVESHMAEDENDNDNNRQNSTVFDEHNKHYPEPQFPTANSEPNSLHSGEVSPEVPLLYHQVVSLHNQGHSIRDIASQLNRGQGEVSLILNITSKRRAI